METKFYVGKDHYEDAYSIRKQVFMIEQGFQSEEDEIDNTCVHCVIYDQDKPVACGRYFSESENQMTVGRIAVLKEYRGQQLGNLVMKAIEKNILETSTQVIRLSAQVQAKSFYEKLGYECIGEEYLDEHCPHIMMIKKISQLDKARLIINEVDRQMANLFEKRMKAVEMVIEYKIKNNLPIFDESRELIVIEQNLKLIKNENLKEYYRRYIIEMMNISKTYQKEILNKSKKITTSDK